ncbi:hypothetical protein [Mesorhizobium sp.]|uniref:hypothetical protein n=1 Tax=Mesorhizobium sp. TaxID=1871066 RepID=UPI000FE9B0A5|nr:hypothetical protein [Mesorhizobium sp.]RWM26567.1 MAG: hypothetical protein EOR74_14490 [Mesorhizobium sp.]RWM42528.1 MAG: hypothetical protein EOR75_01275 [Mesorhizobium sp.]TIO79380.1 MAG: hypothetical protein E5X75_02160 [Mesorhizobium sp.]TIO85994.1 MAG: hypothetical protein E5X74_10285 [Mesorhizobium sp.]TJV52987.1 MAG: hypothetical protein E5Y01_07225 [Mesorhizobium sp.]
MKSVILSCVLPVTVAVATPLGLVGKAFGAEPDKQFFRSVEGKWIGPGEIIAGKYKGTKFTCNFNGSTPDGKVGMTLDGDCRVGVFTQKMSASVERKGREGYKGNFMGGSTGNGLDIIGGNVVDPQKVVFTINRNQLNGVMQARIPDDNSMTVTVAVRVNKQLVPVIGMSLKRVDTVEVGSIAKN